MASGPRKLKPGIKTPRRSGNSIEERVKGSDRAVAGSKFKAEGVQTAQIRAHRLKEYLDPYTEEMADITMGIARNRKIHASIRLEAATRILDRVYGKPKETVAVQTEDPVNVGDEVTTLLNSILEKVGAPLIEAPKTDE